MPLTAAGNWYGAGNWFQCEWLVQNQAWQPGNWSLQDYSCGVLRTTGMAVPCSVSCPCFGWKGRQNTVCVRSLALIILGASALGFCFALSSQTGFLIKLKCFSARAQGQQLPGAIRAARDTGRAWLPAAHASLSNTPPKTASSGAGQTFHTIGLQEGKHRQVFFRRL